MSDRQSSLQLVEFLVAACSPWLQWTTTDISCASQGKPCRSSWKIWWLCCGRVKRTTTTMTKKTSVCGWFYFEGLSPATEWCHIFYFHFHPLSLFVVFGFDIGAAVRIVVFAIAYLFVFLSSLFLSSFFFSLLSSVGQFPFFLSSVFLSFRFSWWQ